MVELPLRLPYGPRYNSETGKFDSPELKSTGFYGPLKTHSGDIASEYSTSAPIDGKEVDYPTLVPGLSGSQLASALMAAAMHQPVPQDVADVAYDHAARRVQAGQSPFWDQRIDPYPAWSPNQEWADPRIGKADGGGLPYFAQEDPDKSINDALRFAQQLPTAREEPTLRAYEPSIGERVSSYLMGDSRPTPERRRVAESIGSLVGLLPTDPYPAAGEAAQQFTSGHPVDAFETMFGAMPQTGALKGYHGSKSLWDKVDFGKLYSGEGIGGWGAGLYMGPRNAAQHYRTLGEPGASIANDILSAAKFNPEDALRVVNSLIRSDKEWGFLDMLETHKNAKKILENPPGYAYKIMGHVSPEETIDFKKPASVQSDVVKRALDNIGVDPKSEVKMGDAWATLMENSRKGILEQNDGISDLSAYNMATDDATAKLRDYGVRAGVYGLPANVAWGVKGMKPHDKHSVIYDPEAIEILRTFGVGEHLKADGGAVNDQIAREEYGLTFNELTPREQEELSASAKGRSDSALGLHSIPITPRMREAIMKGLPAYAAGGAVTDPVEDALRLAASHRGSKK